MLRWWLCEVVRDERRKKELGVPKREERISRRFERKRTIEWVNYPSKEIKGLLSKRDQTERRYEQAR